MNYTLSGKEFSFHYQELKQSYEVFSGMSDEVFIKELPNIIHFACFVSYMKELNPEDTIGDEGIVHQLVHLLTQNDNHVKIKEVRADFDRLLKLS